MPNCPSCGTPAPAGARFCGSCGAAVELSAGPDPAGATVPGQAPAGAITIGGYDVLLTNRPSFSVATVYLRPGQALRAESGAMVAMSANIDLSSRLEGGLLGALKRAVTRESLFQTTF